MAFLRRVSLRLIAAFITDILDQRAIRASCELSAKRLKSRLNPELASECPSTMSIIVAVREPGGGPTDTLASLKDCRICISRRTFGELPYTMNPHDSANSRPAPRWEPEYETNRS